MRADFCKIGMEVCGVVNNVHFQGIVVNQALLLDSDCGLVPSVKIRIESQLKIRPNANLPLEDEKYIWISVSDIEPASTEDRAEVSYLASLQGR